MDARNLLTNPPAAAPIIAAGENTPPNKPKPIHNDVAKSLKQDEILIEFTRYYPYRIFDESLDLENPKYLALTLNANSEVKVFDLGNAIKLEDKIFEAYWSIRDIKRDISEIEYYLDQVSELVFQKDLIKPPSGKKNLNFPLYHQIFLSILSFSQLKIEIY